MKRRMAAMGFVGLSLFCVGCVDTTVDNDVYTYRFEDWIPISLILFSFIVFGIVAALRKKLGSWAWIVMLLSVAGGCVLGPSALMDQAVVTDTEFRLSVGLWFDRNEFHVVFDDVDSMSLSPERDGNRGGSSLYLICNLKDGSIRKVPVGTLMQEGPLLRIMFIAAILDIPVKLN